MRIVSESGFRLIASLVVCGLLSATAIAHNNPSFREELLLEVAVSAEPDTAGSFGPPFSLTWPDNTVQLIWRVSDPAPDSIRFSVMQDGQEALTDLGHQSLSARLKGQGIAITKVAGAKRDFHLQIFAKVLDRSLGNKALDEKK